MPRIRQELRPRPSAAVVQKITALYAALQRSQREELDHAFALGTFLGEVPEDERWLALHEATGLSKRSGQNFVRMAEHRDAIEQAIAQRVARASIRGAITFLRNTAAKTRVGPFLWQDWLTIFEGSHRPRIQDTWESGDAGRLAL
jgi:hypothetical protein